jgi:hypothetical protein
MNKGKVKREKVRTCFDCFNCKVSKQSTEKCLLCFCSETKKKKPHKETYWMTKQVCKKFEEWSA